MNIDAHQHFWKLSRGDYGWLTPDLAGIHRDFLPPDLAPVLAARRIDRTILVQAAPTAEETRFLLRLARDVDFVAGVVGWADFEAEDAADQIARLARQLKLKGLRPMIQDLVDDSWMLRESIAPAIEAMIAADLCFDALIKPRHLPVLRRFADRWPDLRIVIDHGAKPDIASGDLTSWSGEIGLIAAGTRLLCKLSGLVTEAAPGCGADELRAVTNRLLETFGPARLMWGSDWPVVNLNGGYNAWRAAAESLLNGLTAGERDWIFGRTAAGFYGVSACRPAGADSSR